ELGTWEHGFEWGGYGELVGVLRAPAGEPIAFVVTREHGGPDMASARVVAYRLKDADFERIYEREIRNVNMTGDHATLTLPDGSHRIELRWQGSKVIETETTAAPP